MTRSAKRARVILWIARITGTLVIIPLMMIALGEPGHGPAGPREWVYLLLFPFGFSAGYLLAWRWPLSGGSTSLLCMAASLLVIGRHFDAGAYGIWAAVSVPGVLYVLGGWMRRGRDVAPMAATDDPPAGDAIC